MTDPPPSLRDLLAETILKHFQAPRGGSWRLNPTAAAESILSDPRIAAVRLPGAETSELDATFWPCTAPGLDASAKVQIGVDGRIFLNGIPNPLRNADQAAEVAAALLAAAQHVTNRGELP